MFDALTYDSAGLSEMRELLDRFPAWKATFGEVLQLKVVLDANMAASDLIKKAKEPGVTTAIEEGVQSSLFLLYAPRWLEKEMLSSAIPKVAKKTRLAESILIQIWSEYQSIIIWNDEFDQIDPDSEIDGDPKDLPYILLERAIDAFGILSNDKHIGRMGGNQLQFEFVLIARDYARAKGYSLAIRVGGASICTVSALTMLAIGAGLVEFVRVLPDWAKIALVAAVVLAIAHPASRNWLLERLSRIRQFGAQFGPHVLRIIEEGIEKEKEAEAVRAEISKFAAESAGDTDASKVAN